MFISWLMVQGCMELLVRSGVEIAGKRAVVVGRSNIVGLPAALMLQVRVIWPRIVFVSMQADCSSCAMMDLE